MSDKLIITEEALNDLSILREKIKVVLDCIIYDAGAREQTLAYIATDYLGEMKKTIQAMFNYGMTFDN